MMTLLLLLITSAVLVKKTLIHHNHILTTILVLVHCLVLVLCRRSYMIATSYINIHIPSNTLLCAICKPKR